MAGVGAIPSGVTGRVALLRPAVPALAFLVYLAKAVPSETEIRTRCAPDLRYQRIGAFLAGERRSLPPEEFAPGSGWVVTAAARRCARPGR